MKVAPPSKALSDAIGLVLQRLDRDILGQAELLAEEERKAEEQARIVAQASAKLQSLRVTREHLAEQVTPGAPAGHKQTQASNGTTGAPRAVGRQGLNHDEIALEVFRELAPEFTSHDFQARCLAKYPGRENEFSRTKIKKRLRKHAGFDDAPITLIAKGGGRRPPRFRVNPRN